MPEQKFTKQRKSIFKEKNYDYWRIVYVVGAEFKAKGEKSIPYVLEKKAQSFIILI